LQVPHSPHSSDDGVDIPDFMEKDDSNHSDDVIGQHNVSPLASSPGVAPLVIIGSFPISGEQLQGDIAPVTSPKVDAFANNIYNICVPPPLFFNY
jgi:hypothetical protein